MKIAYCEYDFSSINTMLSAHDYVIRHFCEGLSEDDYGNVEIVFGNPPKEKLVKFQNLRFLQLRSAGANGYDDADLYRAVQEKDLLKVATAQGVYNQPMAEYVLGMMCLLGKRSISAYVNPKAGRTIFGGGGTFRSRIDMIWK